MRRIHTDVIRQAVHEALMEIGFVLPVDVKAALELQRDREEQPVAKSILTRIVENSGIAETKRIPLCQDTGMVVVFMELGQSLVLEGPYVEDAINAAVESAYREGYLRKSTVTPISRENRKDNTPAVIHCRVVPGDRLRLTVAAKGFGSENMSRMRLLKPSEGLEGILDFVVEAVEEAGPNPCPPIVVGVGIGGTIEKAAWMAKHALMREIGSRHQDEELSAIEETLLKRINGLNIGPMGMGGLTTALGVFVETYPTHIAGLPVVVNINCHSSRHKEVVL